MDIQFSATKLVVNDVDAAEHFYRAVGLNLVSRNVGGEAEVRQQQSWLSATGGADAHILILTRFLELEPRPQPTYPGEIWLALKVSDVEEIIDRIETAGGRVLRAGQDRPEHGVRAAVVCDPEGHVIELVGPMRADAP